MKKEYKIFFFGIIKALIIVSIIGLFSTILNRPIDLGMIFFGVGFGLILYGNNKFLKEVALEFKIK